MMSCLLSATSDKWPWPVSILAVAVGMCLRSHSPCAKGTMRSRSPCQTVTGVEISATPTPQWLQKDKSSTIHPSHPIVTPRRLLALEDYSELRDGLGSLPLEEIHARLTVGADASEGRSGLAAIR